MLSNTWDTWRVGPTGHLDLLPHFDNPDDGSNVSVGLAFVVSSNFSLGDPHDFLVTESAGTLWDYDTQETLVGNALRPYALAEDVDGDGRVDVCDFNGLKLTSESGWAAGPYPPDVDDDGYQPGTKACLPDLTGDGLGDLIFAAHKDYGPWFPKFGESVSLYAGGAGGFAADPVWTEALFFDAAYSIVAIQRDDDPELELAALTRPLDPYGYVDSSSLVFIDDVGTAPHRVGAYPVQVDHGFDSPFEPQLIVLGDIDGDGYDDLALQELYGQGVKGALPEEIAHIRLVSGASSGLSEVDVLAHVRFDAPLCDGSVDGMSLGAGDLNADGLVDLYGVVTDRCSDSWVQIWYGPLSDLMDPAADTGDTGPTATGDTGTGLTPTDTNAATGSTADTASDPDPGPSPRSDPPTKGCGCHAAPSTPIHALFRRRGAP